MAESSRSLQSHRSKFEQDGFLHVEGIVGRQELGQLAQSLQSRLAADQASGTLPRGGGSLSGHLNCFPGAESRFVYETLERAGIIELVRALALRPLSLPNVGCNLNLSGSSAQNEHVDGYAAAPFLIVNVAAVDTDLANGATEILPGTQQRDYKYWEIMLGGLRRERVIMKQGDVLIRTSSLWHRGMPNRTPHARPMLAFTWEDGGSQLADPYAVHSGRITFLPNRFATSLRGRMIERACVSAPRLGRTYQMVRSLFL